MRVNPGLAVYDLVWFPELSLGVLVNAVSWFPGVLLIDLYRFSWIQLPLHGDLSQAHSKRLIIACLSEPNSLIFARIC